MKAAFFTNTINRVEGKAAQCLIPVKEKKDSADEISALAAQSWKIIAPFWPLKNLIAVNPLKGLEEMPFEKALIHGMAYFQQPDLPKPMEAVNRETIKWLQAFFDDGQATISMPLRKSGLYAAWRQLAEFDARLHGNDSEKHNWLSSLPNTAEYTISHCLCHLSIPKEEYVQFLTLLLTTLPGWAAHIKYRIKWAEKDHAHPASEADYLAMRLVIVCLLWPKAKFLLTWHRAGMKKAEIGSNSLKQIEQAEANFRLPLLKQLTAQPMRKIQKPAAQLVFCIDVRSEPFRKALEAAGNYETFGFAGFFGIPVRISNPLTEESYSSCPVLLSPKHEVEEVSYCADEQRKYKRLISLKQIYQSLKYTFAAPFALVETMGIGSFIWMALRTLAPRFSARLKKSAMNQIRTSLNRIPSLNGIPLAEQCSYAEGALKMMGLTEHFAPLVVFCGHGSATQNNAYAAALDCGACGGRRGGSNARILAAILNCAEVREYLNQVGIRIPKQTRFIAAEHNTTTDEVVLYDSESDETFIQLKEDLEKARHANCSKRLKQMDGKQVEAAAHHMLLRSQDWAQVRPEWGLASNAAFIAAPRALTHSLDLQGRCFLHSYDYTQDPDGAFLTTILTAPMVVAQWINAQYLFSALDNVAYGGGSKITKNITGKLGIMQGNASDLMTGLSLQSVHLADTLPYHEPQRLMTVVYAKRTMLDKIIQAQPILQNLFCNDWVQLLCLEPDSMKIYTLQRDLKWK